jgi:hypothetical protein
MQINIQKRHLVILIAILAVLGIGFVIASTWSNIATHVGHSWDEIQPSNCSAGQFVNGTDQNGVICSTPTNFPHHWEKSWKRYPVEGADLASEKTACDVGNCILKMDSCTCDPSSPTCACKSELQSCGITTDSNNEMLFCLGG